MAKNVPEVLEWPVYSPDLNPLENLWGIIKGNVERRMPNNQADLKQFMLEEWQKIHESTLNSLVNSIKERCKLVISKGGEHIPY